MSKTGTRNANKMGSVRKRSDGRYEGRYTAPDGRQRSIYGTSQTTTTEALRAAMHDVDNGTWLEPSRMTLNQWFDIWLSDYQGHTTGRTVETYTAVIKRHMRPLFGSVKLADFSPIHVRRMVSSMTKSGCAPTTVKHARGILSAALNGAIEAGLIKDNAVKSVKPPRMIKRDFTIIDREQIPAFIEAAQTTKYPDALIFLLMTGVRVGEMRGLRWTDIDFENNTIRIDRQLHALSMVNREMRPPKDGESRTIHITPETTALLKAHRKTQLAQQVAAKSWLDDDITSGLVFRKANGANLDESSLQYAIEQVRAAMNLPGLRLHDLRHSYAVAALRSGIDVKTVQHNLGHKHASITLDIYASYTDDAGKTGAEKLSAYWRNAISK